MKNSLRISAPALTAMARSLNAASDPVQVVPAGVNLVNGHRELLVASVLSPPAASAGPCVTAVKVEAASDIQAALTALAAHPAPGLPCLRLAVGVGVAAGHLGGVVVDDRSTAPLDEVAIIGPGLLRVRRPESDGGADELSAEMWSRSRGALGTPEWERLQALRVVVVGAGRLGSALSMALVRAGVSRISLVDPDVLAIGNIGEMQAVGISQVGRPKVEGLAAALVAASPSRFPPRIEQVAASVLSYPALVAAKAADVICSCPDNLSARLGAAALAALYLRPHLDLGVAVVDQPGMPHRRSLGADVRLALPGRCLMCLGGTGEAAEARHALRGPSTYQVPWNVERRGSLGSLAGLTANLGLRVLEDLVAGRVRDSMWLQFDTDEVGVPTLGPVSLSPPTTPCLCSLVGRGDAGIAELDALIGQW